MLCDRPPPCPTTQAGISVIICEFLVNAMVQSKRPFVSGKEYEVPQFRRWFPMILLHFFYLEQHLQGQVVWRWVTAHPLPYSRLCRLAGDHSPILTLGGTRGDQPSLCTYEFLLMADSLQFDVICTLLLVMLNFSVRFTNSLNEFIFYHQVLVGKRCPIQRSNHIMRNNHV